MSEFMRNKVHFALALLGTLFVLLTFEDNKNLEQVTHYTDFVWTVSLFGDEPVSLQFKLLYAFAVGGALLSLAVYCYAMAIMTERSLGTMERLGNLGYALAVLVLPVYALICASHWAAERFGWDQLHYFGPAALGGIGLLWLLVGFLLRWRLTRHDRRDKMRHLSHLEVEHVRKARDMADHHHYDMAIIEAWKAVEARLHRLLLHRGYTRRMTPHQMIKTALQIGIIPPDMQRDVQHLQHQWNVAIGTQPLTKDAAETALATSRRLMAILPLEDHDPHDVARKKV